MKALLRILVAVGALLLTVLLAATASAQDGLELP